MRYFSSNLIQRFLPAVLVVSCEQGLETTIVNDPVIQKNDGINSLSAENIIEFSIFLEKKSFALGESFKPVGLAKFANDPDKFENVSDMITWTSTSKEIVDVSNSSGPGFKGLSEGTVTLSGAIGNFVEYLDIEIGPAEIVSFRLEPEIEKIGLGTHSSFTLISVYSDLQERNLPKQVTLTSSDITSLEFVLNEEGLKLDAKKVGTYDLIVSALNKEFRLPLEVVEEAVYELGIDIESNRIPVGVGVPFQLYGKLADEKIVDLTEEVELEIGNSDVVKIQNGLLFGNQVGSSLVSASYEGLDATLSIVVLSAAVSNLDIVMDSDRLPIGASQAISLVAEYTDASYMNLDRSFITVSPSVVAEVVDMQIHCRSRGSASLRSELFGASAEQVLECTEAVPEKIVIEPSELVVPINDTSKEYSATLIYTDGSTVQLVDRLIWSLKNISFNGTEPILGNNVSNLGRVIAAPSAGTAVVSAEFSDPTYGITFEGEASLIVTNELSGIRLVSYQDAYPPDVDSIKVASGLSQRFKVFADYLDGASSDVTTESTFYLDYYSTGFGPFGYIQNATVGQSVLEVKTSGQGFVQLHSSYKGFSSSVIIETVEPTAETINCAIVSGAVETEVSSAISIECSLLLSDGSSLSHSEIDASASWAANWTISNIGYPTFPGMGTFDDDTSASPVFTTDAFGEGYVRLNADALFNGEVIVSTTLQVVIRRSCVSGLSLGGETDEADGLFCWHVGAAGESCSVVCGANGGVQPATGVYGSDAIRCKRLVEGVYNAPTGFNQSSELVTPGGDISGLGCSVHEYTSFSVELYSRFLGTGTSDDSASNPSARRICSCMN